MTRQDEGMSFSIVLETENLANSDIKGLMDAIAALAHQSLPPTAANEVLLIDSGDTPPDLLAQLCHQYPWINVRHAPAGTRYYKAKMLGAELATGAIVVYYDCDCIYEPNWLQTMLTSFTRSDIQLVSGETTTRSIGIYGTAMALTYIFPQYSGRENLTPVNQYFLNNVAFRREFLLQHPIPFELPLYRGHCAIHAHELRQQGYTIWSQPQARATHAPPNGLSHFFWRFLLIGHDYYWQKKLLRGTALSDPTMSGVKGKMQVFSDRVSKMFVNNPRHLIFFPLAMPIAITSAILIYVGYLITSLNPHYLLKTYDKILGE
jgi:glycosyltransferase involved in cell wall biosynthesis